MCFILDAINFSFWPDTGRQQWKVQIANGEKRTGYWALVYALQRGVRENRRLLDPRWLRSMTDDDTACLLRGIGTIPLLHQRTLALRELGRELRDSSSLLELVLQSGGEVVAFIDTVIDRFPLFRDESVYRGRRIGFYKRAQLLVHDLSLVLSHFNLRPFSNLDYLTAFADYKIPQLLRALGVLHYDETLAFVIDREQSLQQGSAAETEIRGATVHAVELLRGELRRKGFSLTSAEIDNILWTEAKRRDLKNPHHRTRTTYY